MKWFITAFLLVSFNTGPILAAQCESLISELRLPVKAKTRGKPRVVRWELVDKTMNSLDQLEGVSAECKLTFGEIFESDRENLYFPLTNTLIRVAPEGTFNGLKFYSRDEVEQGTYEHRITFERTGGLYARNSYQVYIFQYTTPSGRLMKIGPQLLLDSFVLKWEDIKDKVAYSASADDE